MDYSTFAAIDVGSHEISMKIYEIGAESGIHVLDYVHHSTKIGLETYSAGRMTYASIERVCRILNAYKEKMKEYGVKSYQIVGTSAVREAENNILFLEQVKEKTGFTIKVLSNSEQRAVYYKSLAITDNSFHKLIKKGTLLVDVSGGSMQLSHYDCEQLISTQNLKLGSLRIQETLSALSQKTVSYKNLVYEYIYDDIHNYKEHFLAGYNIKNIIAVGNQLRIFMRYLSRHNFASIMPSDSRLKKKDTLDRAGYDRFYNEITSKTPQELTKDLDTSFEQASLLLPVAMIYEIIFSETDAENMWLSDITLCDGMAADFAESHEKMIPAHNSEDDIISETKVIADKYKCNKEHYENIMYNSLKIFDFLKESNFMTSRDRLLLQLAVILHDTGSFINLSEVGENSYKIVMSTEILGLSHKERSLIALTLLYLHKEFPGYNALKSDVSKKDYIRITKLNAIIKLAGSMDKSHTQKFKKTGIEIKDEKLYITGDTITDITLERGFFEQRADFFEEVFGIRPELRQRKNFG